MTDQMEPRRESETETKRSYELPSVVELGDLAELTSYTVSVKV
jgi:hypothetical protein